jgi:flagellar hook-associated protein 1
MSLTHSITNAVSGLVATSRAAEIVSNNVANAMTEGYARRELELSARNVGGRGAGVSIDGVKRVVDEALLRDRRLADAAVGENSARADFYAALERLIGTPEDAGSLDARVAAFEKSLIEAASRPDSLARLQSVSDAAAGLTAHLNRISEGVQQLRMDAEDEIAIQVQTLNASLKQVADLNTQIVSATAAKRDTSALLDLRQQEIDRISSIVPLRVIDRENGQVALFTMNGGRLVDGRASVVEFEPTRLITAEMSLAGGTLNGILVDGRPDSTTPPNGAFAGGSLGALFQLRDELSVTAQSQVDAFARDMIERFEDAAVDPTVTAGNTGLFTDLGAPIDPLNEVGLAGRIGVNALVVPDQGGDLWRLRDGIHAPTEGDVGNGARLQALADALNARRTPGSGGLPPNRSASGLSAYLLSSAGVSRQQSETTLVGATNQQQTLRQMQLADGVDTDAEMQRLMLIEQAYAANARVLTVVDEMMQALLRI